MKDILEMFNKIPHVRGSFVFDSDRRLLCGNGEPLYPNEVLGPVSVLVGEALDFFMQTQAQAQSPGWDSVLVSFAEGVMLLKSLPKGAVLAVCAQEQVNQQMMRISANVAAQRLKLPISAPPLVSAPPSAPSPPPPPAPPPPPVVVSKAQVRPAAAMDAATQDIAEKLTRALAFSIGPVARVIVKRAVQALAPDGKLRSEHWEELLRQLEREIDSPKGRAEFRQRIS